MAVSAMLAAVLTAASPAAAGQAEMCVALPKGASVADVEAREEAWFINAEPMLIDNNKYVKYGLPRVLQKGDVVLFTRYKTAVLYREPSDAANEVFYVPTNLAACEFQPYYIEK